VCNLNDIGYFWKRTLFPYSKESVETSLKCEHHAPPHTHTHTVVDILSTHLHSYFRLLVGHIRFGLSWPPYSFDINSHDYFLGGFFKDYVTTVIFKVSADLRSEIFTHKK
jgi:hypothetical protein